uniref:Uncharacterized protein n=1 Tax=Cacopsylla melanoneura TaxID=428564 RepID=A0A8D9E1R5_9HEMI
MPNRWVSSQSVAPSPPSQSKAVTLSATVLTIPVAVLPATPAAVLPATPEAASPDQAMVHLDQFPSVLPVLDQSTLGLQTAKLEDQSMAVRPVLRQSMSLTLQTL